MMKIIKFSFLMFFGVIFQVFAFSDDVPLPQDAMMRPSVVDILQNYEDIQQIVVMVDMKLGSENPRWIMSQTQMQVLVRKLADLPDVPRQEDKIWPKLPRKDPAYRGVVLTVEMLDGRMFAPLRVFEGKLLDGKQVVAKDYGRMLEYWLFGTARVRRDQLLGVNVLPVISFEQCRIMGQKVVETTPRQCLLPDNNLLLETTEPPTVASAKLRDFDECLKSGVALIYTFPRRCVAAGGRVFTEPPRVFALPGAVSPSGVVSGGLISGSLPHEPGSPVPIGTVAVSVTTDLRALVGDVVSLTAVSESQKVLEKPVSLSVPVVVSGTAVDASVTRYNWRDLNK